MDKIKNNKNDNVILIIVIVFLICTFICIFAFNVSTLFALDNSTMMNANCVCDYNKCVCNINYREAAEPKILETFENDEDVNETFENVNKFKRITLLPLDYDNQITNMLLSGEADVYKSDKFLRIDISCSLYELGADVYNVKSADLGKYQAYLYNKETQKKLILGDLVKHGDGFYKLTYVSDNPAQLSEFTSLYVVYIKNSTTTVLIQSTL